MDSEIDAVAAKSVIFLDQDTDVAAMVPIDMHLIAVVVRLMGEWDSDRHCCQNDANPNAQRVSSL